MRGDTYHYYLFNCWKLYDFFMLQRSTVRAQA
nr:MAG TPA: hypothetical protein [Caudoviricetes sp.]